MPVRSTGFLFVLLVGVFVVYVKGQPASSPCGKFGNYWSASICCGMNGTALPTIKTNSDGQVLRDKLLSHNIKYTWLAIQRKLLTSWQWTDGVQAGISLNDYPGFSNGTCAWLNQRSRRLESGPCSDRTAGSICAFHDSQCSRGILSHIGISYKDVCYTHFCGGYTWHEARAHCRQNGYEIANVKSQEVIDILSHHKWNCNRFWIGLRKEEWADSESMPVEVIYSHWDSVRNIDVGKCGYFKTTISSWLFLPASCHSERPYLCQAVQLHPTNVIAMSALQTRSSVNTELTENWKTIVIIVLAVTAVLLATTLAVFIWKRKHHGSNARLRERVPLDSDPESLTDLISKDSEEWELTDHLQHKIANAIIRQNDHIKIWEWEDQFASVKLDELFTELVIRTKKNQLEQVEIELGHYTDMFTKPTGSNVDRSYVYLQGLPGTGKTTLMRRILVDWAKYIMAGWWEKWFRIPKHIKTHLGKFQLILPLFLREVTPGQSPTDAITQQLHLHDKKGYLNKIIENNQENILIILEGLDEFREELSQDITSILKQELWTNINIVITCRNPPTLHFKEFHQRPDFHVILKGFSDLGVSSYINRFFKKRSDGNSLKSEINKTETKDLSRYPAILLLMCILWRNEHKLSNSVTEFYLDFIQYACGRYERKYVPKDEQIESQDILTAYHSDIMEIGEVAVNGLKGERLELNFAPQVLQKLGKTAKLLGFFNWVPYSGKRKACFQHKSIQEFFAAYFIVHCEAEMRKDLLTQFVETPHALRESSMIVTFLRGLGKEEITNIIRDIISGSGKDAIKANTAIQLAYLSELKKGECVLPKSLELEMRQDYSTSLLQRYFSMDSSLLKDIVISTSSVMSVYVLKWLHGVRLSSLKLSYNAEHKDNICLPEVSWNLDGGGTVDTLYIVGFSMAGEEDIISNLALQCKHIEYQSVPFRIVFTQSKGDAFHVGKMNFQNSLELDDLPVLTSGFDVTEFHCQSDDIRNSQEVKDWLGNSTTITKLSLIGCSDVLQMTVPHIGRQTELEILNMSGGNITLFHNMGEILLKFSKLTEFRFKDMEQSNEHSKQFDQGSILSSIVKGLSTCSKLEVLDLSGTSMDGHTLKCLEELLSLPRNVREIRFGVFEGNGLCSLLKQFPYYENLQVLALSGTVLLRDSLTKLAALLAGLKNVTEFRIGSCNDDQEITRLVNTISTFKHLRVLDMSYAQCGPKACDALVELLHTQKDLTAMHFGRNKGGEDVKHLVKELKEIRNIITLEMSRLLLNKETHSKIGVSLKSFSQLQQFLLGKCDVTDALVPYLENLGHIPDIELLDLSGNIRNPKIYEVLDVRGTTDGNKVTEAAYKILAEGMKTLSHLRHLRLCQCDDLGGLSPVISSLEYTTKLQSLDLAGNISDPDVCAMLGEKLKFIPEIKSLRLCACDQINAIQQVIENLKYVPRLQELDISGMKAKRAKRMILAEYYQNSNYVDEKSYEELALQMKNLPELRELRLCKSDQLDAVSPVIAALHHLPKLHTLDLLGNQAGRDVFKHLGKQLEKLNCLRKIQLLFCPDNNAIKSALEHIKYMRGLVVLDVTGVKVGGKDQRGITSVKRNIADRSAFKTLRNMLEFQSNLLELRIPECDLKCHGAGIGILEVLNNSLQILEIGARSLNAAGVEQLSVTLGRLKDMRQLLLSECTLDYNAEVHPDHELGEAVRIHRAWATCMSRLSALPFLQVLNLNRNSIGNESVVELAKQLPSLTQLDSITMIGCGLTDTKAVFQLIDALPSCPTMKILSFRDNNLGDGLRKITEKTEQLQGLYMLYLNYTHMTKQVISDIQKVVELKLPRLVLHV